MYAQMYRQQFWLDELFKEDEQPPARKPLPHAPSPDVPVIG
jgi:hypothetical protein